MFISHFKQWNEAAIMSKIFTLKNYILNHIFKYFHEKKIQVV